MLQCFVTVGRQTVRTTPGTISPASPFAFFSRISTKSLVSPTYRIPAANFILSPTYAITGGCIPTQKCRRADIGYSLSAVSGWLSGISSPLSSFTTSLTQKQGSRGCWSYQFDFGCTDPPGAEPGRKERERSATRWEKQSRPPRKAAATTAGVLASQIHPGRKRRAGKPALHNPRGLSKLSPHKSEEMNSAARSPYI